MKYVYADNYRGFADTLIELKNVNFFVGENSTGKTSIMSAISLLSDPDFWFKQDFNASPHRLGQFSDIVSKHSKNKRYFSLGLFEFDENNMPSGHIFKYCNRNNKPIIKEILVLRDEKIIHTKLTNKKLFVKFEEIEKPAEDKLAEISKIVDSFNNSSNGFVAKTMPFPLLGAQIPMLFGMIYSFTEKEVEPGRGFTFQLPGVDLFKWVAPIRTQPKSIYESYEVNYSPEGDHTPIVLNNLLSKEEKELIKSIEMFGKSSGLFQRIRTRTFGKKSNAPFEVRITLNDAEFGLNKVGYGVSQILPIIVDLLSKNNQSYAIQQPEVHLHPKAQAHFGELMHSVSIHNNSILLVETHSDYLIDRFRLAKSKSNENCDSQVLFFERNNSGNDVHCIKIDDDGKYSNNQPDGFRDFFLTEQFSLLGI